MRLTYIDPTDPTAFPSPEDAATVSRIQERRHPRPLQPLDLTLLHCPPVADGWNSFLGAIRTKTNLSQDVKELAICRVAVLNKAWYEWAHHAPLAREGGISDGAMDLIQHVDLGGYRSSAELSDVQWAVLEYTDAMTKDVTVRDEVFDALRRYFTEADVVALTATIATYNCVSRFLVALDVGEKNRT